ncbi:nitrilase and fragile histidine triad fusion protein NitFhit-like [Liolophura sinensis]|uniref:nitrilase and fragile histidine triad fusion protein NitFhit-like n=1 Tax=Liolophura sinensis TaxID=3198878 RepID=UPI0031595B4F
MRIFSHLGRRALTVVEACRQQKCGMADMVGHGRRCVVGVCQMNCTSDKEANFSVGKSLITRAKRRGAKMVFLPECFDYVGEDKEKSLSMAETLEGDLITRYRHLAKEQDVWLSLGGFHHKGPPGDGKAAIKNMHIILDNQGDIKAHYSKTHLFDIEIKDKVCLKESDFVIPGQKIVPPVPTPVGKVGLAICYDLRFPELSIALTQQGAELLTFPSAFTQTTGLAHWESLLRSRAIENQCYVLAAAQTGKHNAKRTSYGHAMIVDPWGCVVAQCHEGVDVCFAEVDLDYLHKVRTDMPVQQHRRQDLYGYICVSHIGEIESDDSYQFGDFSIRNTQVFFRSALCIGFVNIKPVVPGHVLVAPLRPAKRFADLTQPEVSDMFACVQKISGVLEGEYGAKSLTIAVQDGEHAGQTVQHVHVHILPRKPGDFAFNDDIYKELDAHDKNVTSDKSKLRSEEDMAEESFRLRKLFRQ